MPMKAHTQQSIWPVSVFGLGFMLLIMGLTGVASIQETRRIHEQILAVEDNYRHIEKMLEGIRSDTFQADLLRRDRLLDSGAGRGAIAHQLEVTPEKIAEGLKNFTGLGSAGLSRNVGAGRGNRPAHDPDQSLGHRVAGNSQPDLSGIRGEEGGQMGRSLEDQGERTGPKSFHEPI